ncbi:hypothetical protein AH332_21790 [Salmonella enterica subsp. salamae]|nr:hypothetical protein [Salmonella enterica subsp. salamae]
MNRGRYRQRHRCSGLQVFFYIGCQKYGTTSEKKPAIHGELLTLQSDLMIQHFVNHLICL